MESFLAQIQKGEGQKTEFKTSFQKEVIETVVAFANAKGGKVFVGVNDSGEIIGTTVSEESIQNHINTIKQNTQPSVIVDIDDPDYLQASAKTIVRIARKGVTPAGIAGVQVTRM